MHLAEIMIPGKIEVSESDYLLPGKPSCTVFETEYCNIGVGVGSDIRFAEYSAILVRDKGCKILAFPYAYCLRMGELQGLTLMKSRAFEF